MERDAVIEALVAIIAEVTLARPEGAHDGSLLGEDLGVESIDLLDIVFQVEERLGVSLSPLPPFLDGAFYDPRRGNLVDGALTAAGRDALGDAPGLDPRRLAGEGASAYLRSVGALADWVIHRRQARPDAVP